MPCINVSRPAPRASPARDNTPVVFKYVFSRFCVHAVDAVLTPIRFRADRTRYFRLCVKTTIQKRRTRVTHPGTLGRISNDPFFNDHCGRYLAMTEAARPTARVCQRVRINVVRCPLRPLRPPPPHTHNRFGLFLVVREKLISQRRYNTHRTATPRPLVVANASPFWRIDTDRYRSPRTTRHV